MNASLTTAETFPHPPRPNYYTALVRALVYLYCVNAFAIFDADTDLWGHLKFGELIWQGKSIPLVDPYSYTAQGLPWINHEWLAEVLFYLIYRVFDSTGLLIFKLLLGLFIVHTLSEIYFSKEKSLIAYAISFLLLPHVLVMGFMTRPQLMTWLFLAWFIYVLNKFFDGNQKALAWTPLIMLLWVNCHGVVVAGIGIYGVAALCQLAQRSGEGKVLLKYFMLSCLALLINPYGYKLWIFFLETIPVKRQISEWDAIPLFDRQFLYFKVMVLLFALTIFTSRSKQLWALAINLIAIYFSFRHQRHMVLAGILLTPHLAAQLAAIETKLANIIRFRPSPPLNAVFHAALATLILTQAYVHFSRYQAAHFKIQVNPRTYPIYAVRFMKLNNINGNIINPFDWGEYLIWHLPGSKVSIDGRLETVYPDRIFKQNLAFSSAWDGWQHVPGLYPATDVILTDKINREIEKMPDWVKIYEDPTAVILVRKMDPPSPTLDKFYKKELVDKNDSPSWEFP